MPGPSVVEQIQERLVPDLGALIDVLIERDEPTSAAFFGSLLQLLTDAQSEEDLLEFTLALSTCAFIGLDYSPVSAQDVDAFLASAERVAHTMTAGDDTAH